MLMDFVGIAVVEDIKQALNNNDGSHYNKNIVYIYLKNIILTFLN